MQEKQKVKGGSQYYAELHVDEEATEKRQHQRQEFDSYIDRDDSVNQS